jgi:hypothetical protein
LVLEEEGIGGGRDRGGGGGAAGWEWTGAGEDGAENREDGEPRLLVSSLRIGDGYAAFNDVDNTTVKRMADRSESGGPRK